MSHTVSPNSQPRAVVCPTERKEDPPGQDAGTETNHGPRPAFPSHLTVLDLLSHHAMATPDARALVALSTTARSAELTFADMQASVSRAAGTLAGALAAAASKLPAPAVPPSDSSAAAAAANARWVMIVLPEGLEQVLAVWSVMRSCCGYVPVDADTQASRLRMLFEETRPVAVIGLPASAVVEVALELGVPVLTFPDGARGGLAVLADDAANPPLTPPMPELPAPPTPDDFALLLYSSGSTGRPKGICYDHRWLMGGSWFVAQDMELTAASHCLLRCSYVWSVSLYDLFPATMVGGTLFVPPPGGHMNVQFIAETIERETIHAVVIQPTLLNLLLDEHNNSTQSSYPLRSLRHVVSSGEKLFTSTAEAFMKSPGLNAKLWNMYGATEAGCTYFACQKGDEQRLAAYPKGVPAGLPQSHVDVFIMRHDNDADPRDVLIPVPTGEIGEICFGGGGDAGFLARGYWQNQAMTDEKFLHTRYGRLYRTGDAGRWHHGQVVVEGRLDRQVKVHGVRIQPESIEAVVKRYTNEHGAMPIKACLVVPSEREPIELTAFLETAASDGKGVDISAVLGFLRQELGRLYVPRHIVHCSDGLPRTASGKPDQSILRRMASEQEEGHRGVDRAVGSDGGGGSVGGVEGKGGGDDGGACGGDDGDNVIRTVLGVATVTDRGDHVWSGIDLRSLAWRALTDHKYRNEPICPGSAFITLASEACRAMPTDLPHWELRNIVFSRPLPLAPPRTLRVEAVLTTTGADIRITSSAPTGSDEQVDHCTCIAHRLDSASAMPDRAPANDEDVDTSEYSVKALYAQLADGGFDYGVQFRVLHESTVDAAGGAGGKLARQQHSPFLLDPVEMDGCFQLAPLVSTLGFTGAPTAIGRVRRFRDCPEGVEFLSVSVVQRDAGGGIGFYVSVDRSVLYVIEGLQLQAFDSLPPEVLRVESVGYTVGTSERRGQRGGGQQRSEQQGDDERRDEPRGAASRIIAIGGRARSDAESVAEQLGVTEVCTWAGPGARVAQISLRSAVLVVRADEPFDPAIVVGVEELLPGLGFELPYRGRVWLIVVGEGGSEHWLCAARAWAAALPALLLSSIAVKTVGSVDGDGDNGGGGDWWAPLLELDAPPCVDNGSVWRLALPESDDAAGEPSFAGMIMRAGSSVAVLSDEATPLTAALLVELESRGVSARLVLPGEPAPGTLESVVLCATGSASVAVFEPICAAAADCVSLVSMAALLPSRHSLGAAVSAGAAAASTIRRQHVTAPGGGVGSADRIIYVPPLMGAGLWFEPAAPAGFHRCTVEALVKALGSIGARWRGDAIVGIPAREEIPRHFSRCTRVSSAVVRTSAEVEMFLVGELSESLTVEASAVSLSTGLTDLGVTSLDSLRLSQRLRRFLGQEFSAFALQNNPTIADLVESLTRLSASEAGAGKESEGRGKVLCLHGFRTSQTVLQQQMLPLHRILDRLGYSLVVPNAPHRTSGPAQFAEGLDDEDSYGWWTYGDGDDGHDGEPIGLGESVEMLASLAESQGPFVGVVGFSQGGAMAARLANTLQASWALLFSPVFVPGHPAQCDCPTLVAFDRADDVFDATQTLLSQLPAGARRMEHTVGHRLPPESQWWAQVAGFLEAQAPVLVQARVRGEERVQDEERGAGNGHDNSREEKG